MEKQGVVEGRGGGVGHIFQKSIEQYFRKTEEFSSPCSCLAMVSAHSSRKVLFSVVPPCLPALMMRPRKIMSAFRKTHNIDKERIYLFKAGVVHGWTDMGSILGRDGWGVVGMGLLSGMRTDKQVPNDAPGLDHRCSNLILTWHPIRISKKEWQDSDIGFKC